MLDIAEQYGIWWNMKALFSDPRSILIVLEFIVSIGAKIQYNGVQMTCINRPASQLHVFGN